MNKYVKAQVELQKANERMLSELSSLRIKNLQISSIGNSIATGFSAMCGNKPLLLRNETLQSQAREKEIEVEIHQFSRFENNRDEHTFNNLMINKKESEFNAESRRDYRMFRMGGHQLLSEEQIIGYYPPTLTHDIGMADAVFRQEEGLANIVIANVGTGAFLDNVTRGGQHFFTNGVAKDRAYIESLLGTIQFNNRRNYANTQVYLCGAPRILNTPLTDAFINAPLQTVAKRYANVTYVPTISRQVLYHTDIMPIPFPDTHYSEEEYLRLLTAVEKKVFEEYQKKSSIIEIDRIFERRSREIEMSETKVDTRDEILSTIEYHANLLEESGKSRTEFLKQARNYLLERYPYDYYFLDKQAIKESSKVLTKHK